MTPDAIQANLDAEKYHLQRHSETAHSFDDLELDYPNADKEQQLDPENASWYEFPKEQCQVCLADDNILPVLAPQDNTPPDSIKKASDKWIKDHANDPATPGSPYQDRQDGSADLVG